MWPDFWRSWQSCQPKPWKLVGSEMPYYARVDGWDGATETGADMRRYQLVDIKAPNTHFPRAHLTMHSLVAATCLQVMADPPRSGARIETVAHTPCT